MSDRRFFYETIANEFDSLMNSFDLERRLSIIFDELLPGDLTGMRTLDLGCGTGWFSQRARARGARLVSADISLTLVHIARRRAQSDAVVADAGALPFAAASIDLIISSEMLEHLPQPECAIQELARVVSPGGVVVLTTPNRRWLWLVNLATRIGLRPFGGYENFLEFDELPRLLSKYGFLVEKHCGFHPWPFQIAFLRPLSRYIDRHYGSSRWGAHMINQAVRARP